jgi:hypothetical protein
MLAMNDVAVRGKRTASRIVAGEAVVLTPSDGKILTLNEAGTRIWEWLSEGVTLDELAGRLEREFAVGRKQAERDVRKFLAELQKRGMIDVRRADAKKGPADG